MDNDIHGEMHLVDSGLDLGDFDDLLELFKVEVANAYTPIPPRIRGQDGL